MTDDHQFGKADSRKNNDKDRDTPILFPKSVDCQALTLRSGMTFPISSTALWRVR